MTGWHFSKLSQDPTLMMPARYLDRRDRVVKHTSLINFYLGVRSLSFTYSLIDINSRLRLSLVLNGPAGLSALNVLLLIKVASAGY